MTETRLSRYERVPARFDELLDDEGRARPHWRAFLAELAGISDETLDARAHFLRDSIESDGVTYNVYADPKGTSRPWELDVLPLILPPDEWARMAAAVAQRARLLDAVLADLYGPQRLLADGLVPPALIFGQRGYLWPMHGVKPHGGTWLHLYAADLARSPDGRWWVLADRTRGPSGAGYALQNRLTLSRAFPDAFRELPVPRLAPFFFALQDSLYHRAPASPGEPPLAVLLTPGPYNETYFEHAFLARYLGFPLVEGQDLIVRDDRVYLKTLRGLRRVHAILRHLDDDYCDPVELRADSALGVPGLLGAVRAGQVLVANALGSGVLETSGLAGFLPPIAERLLGEPLALPSIATWWCGEAPALDHVRRNLSELVVKPTYPTIRRQPVFGHSLDATERAALLARIEAQPHTYVAQEWVHLSHAPTWSRADAGLRSRAISLRVFAAATPSGWTVLPGGLARAAPHDGDVVSMQWGGTSKDTWPLVDAGPRGALPPHRKLRATEVARSAVDVPSRVGENLFWVGRYAARCEATARLLRAALVRLADAATPSAPALASLALVCERVGVLDAAAPHEPEGEAAHELAHDAFIAAATDPKRAGGLAADIQRLHGAAAHVRERMSTDNWHVFNRLPHALPPPPATLAATLAAVDEVMLSCVSLAGFAMDDMTRDETWHFLVLGRRLERLAQLSGVVAALLELPADARSDGQEWLLEAANSIVTFRARYRRAPELLPVLHLVVFDETNPHAVAFQLLELDESLARVSRDAGTEPPRSQLAPAASSLHGFPLDALDVEDEASLDAACADLASRLWAARARAFALSDELTRRYFTHADTRSSFGA